MKYFPIFLKVEGKALVIFGGGADAAAKLRLLQKTDAEILVVAETLDTDVLDLGKATWVPMSPLAFTPPANTALVYAATGDEALDAKLAAKAQSLNLIACAVDQKDPSDFATPALVDRDPVVVAIGTEGAAPVLARQIKTSLEDQLEPNLGQIANAALALRPEVARRTQPGQQRRQFWKDFFARARRPVTQTPVTQTPVTQIRDMGSAQGAQDAQDISPSNDTRDLKGIEGIEAAHHMGHEMLNQLPAPSASLSFIDAPLGRRSLDRQARAALDAADLLIFDDTIHKDVRELARREAIQVHQKDLDATYIAQAFHQQSHVVHIRGQAGPDLLSDIAAGFGLTAQVFPAQALPTSNPGDTSPTSNQGHEATILSYPFAKAA